MAVDLDFPEVSALIRSVRVVVFALLVMALAPFALTPTMAEDATPTGSLPAPTPALPVTLTDATGADVTISDVSRIVPLNGDIAEIVWFLGLGDNVVGVDASATYPESYRSLPQIGFGRQQLSAEGILALNPSIVIGDTTAGPENVIKQVREAGIPVVIIQSYTDLQAPFEKIDAVSQALGVSEAGATLKTQVQGRVDQALALAATSTSHPRVLFLYIRGSAVQLMGGEGSGADTLINSAGGIDAGTEAGVKGFVPISAEALVAAAPDVILVMSGGLESIGGIDGLLEVPGVSSTPAGQNKSILAFDDQYLLGLGPRLGAVLTDLIYGIHPELVRESTPVAATPGA